jgi:GTP-binding protein SAR1
MSFIYNTLSAVWNSFWESLGLGAFIGRNRHGRLLFLGLDNAGKTTLLNRLATGGEIRPYPPTDRPRSDSFRIHGVDFQAWDLGGHEAVRHLWEDYFASDQISAILFLVDVTDPDRFEEAGYELDALLSLGANSNGSRNLQTSHERDPTLPDSVLNDDGGGGDVPHAYALNGSSPSIFSAAAQLTTLESSWRVPVAILLNKCDLQDQAAATLEVLDKIDFGHLQTLHPPHLLQVFRISVLTGEGYPQAFQWVSTFL